MLGAPRAPGHRRGLVAWLRDQPVLMLLVLAGSSALLGYRISEFHALQERRAAADGAGAADGGKGLAAQAASAVAAALCDPCSPCDACPAVQAVQAPACPPPAVVGGPLGGGSDTSLADFYAHDPAFRPVDPTMAATPVCMVVRTYAGHRNMLMAMLASVLLWDHPGLTVYLLDTGKDVPFAELPKLAAMASAMAGRPDAVRLSRWRHGTARAQFPWYTEEDHGYLATDLTLEDLLTVRAEARKRGDATLPCEYLIVTNGDNLYGHDYLAATLGEIKTGACRSGVGSGASELVCVTVVCADADRLLFSPTPPLLTACRRRDGQHALGQPLRHEQGVDPGVGRGTWAQRARKCWHRHRQRVVLILGRHR